MSKRGLEEVYPESSSEEATHGVTRAIRRRKTKKKKQQQTGHSSDEEEEKEQQQQQQQQHESHARFFDHASVLREMTQEVHLKPMCDLLREVKSINMDSDCIHKLSRMNAVVKKTTRGLMRDRKKNIVEGAPASMSLIPEASADVKQQLHFEQSQHEPIPLIRLREARSMLVKPYFLVQGEVAAVPQDHIHKLLRAKTTLSLTLLTAAVQSEMLVQSGSFHFPGLGVRHLPPCYHGTKCRGMIEDTIPGLTERVIFMRAMTEEQWADLKRSNKQPSENANWPCILCGEYNTTHYVLQSRNLLPAGHTLQREDPNEVLQLWYNLVDEEGGYHNRFIFQPNVGEALIEPIVMPNYFTMRAEKAGGVMWRVKRDGIIYHAPTMPQPFIGEREKNFQKGACFTSNSNMPSGRDMSTPSTTVPSSAVALTSSVSACRSPSQACSSNTASSAPRVATITPRTIMQTPLSSSAAAAVEAAAEATRQQQRRGNFLPSMHIFAAALDQDPLSI
jgi:hypothetical protein